MGPSDHLEGQFAPQWGHPSEPKSGPGPQREAKGSEGVPQGSPEGSQAAPILVDFLTSLLDTFGE